MAKQIMACECGSTDLTWHCQQFNKSEVVEGRLRTGDIGTRFYLGCNDCYDTLKVLSGDAVAGILNNL
jgi:hypothetical protein